jgi:Methyltransferase domain
VVVFWSTVVEPILEAASPNVIVEIGARDGNTTVRLLDFGSRSGCVVHSIDPYPGPGLDLAGLRERHGDRFVFHQEMSLDVLGQIDQIDALLIDGDHNWYSVYNELKLVARRAREQERAFPLTMVHDVDWPYGRRDVYKRPETIPDEYRQPFEQSGLVPGQAELSDEGFSPRANHAVLSGTARNGIRTAVEDFLSETDMELRFQSVIGFAGLGILVPEAQLEENGDLRRLLDEFESPQWLRSQCRRIEFDRLCLLTDSIPLHHRIMLDELGELDVGGG